MFSPNQVREFRFVAYDFDEVTGRAQFKYAFDETVEFVETFVFPVPQSWADATAEQKQAVDRALFLLSLVAGISYYKAAIPSIARIESGAVTETELQYLSTVYEKGLGEFSYINQVDMRGRPTFEADALDQFEAPIIELRERSLVPVGGGKDSCVSIETIKSLGKEQTLISVNKAQPILDVMKAAELDSIHVERTLSAELMRINGEGAFNGHVPVTAVVSLAIIVGALLNDFDSVVMSNERSASVGNVEWLGQLVNHQWSKSLEAEMALANLVKQSITPSLSYFSLLRPLSELAITKRFAGMSQFFDVFTSCNRAFRIDESRRVRRWCTECDKCRFVFLALAPFIDVPRLVGIFGKDMLRDLDQAEGFDALIGWNANKPFECVGEVEESVAAFLLLTKSIQWRDHEIVRRFEQEILPQITVPPDVVERVLAPSDRHNVPKDVLDALI